MGTKSKKCGEVMLEIYFIEMQSNNNANSVNNTKKNEGLSNMVQNLNSDFFKIDTGVISHK